VEDAAAFALFTAVAAFRYAAASCETVGVGARVGDSVDPAASGADGVGVAAASGVGGGVGVAVGATGEAAGGLVGATAVDPDD
jgi:hypothetical protein